MGKREQARDEAKFMKGDTGVDGQATAEDTRDAAEIELDKAREAFLRGKAYLGREFLTWLLFKSESSDPVTVFEGAGIHVVFADRLVLRGVAHEVVELSARGAMAPYSPLVKRSLDRGLLVHAGRLRVTHGDLGFHVTLDADHLDCKGAKLPSGLSDADENATEERLDLAERLAFLVESLLVAFLQLRASRQWAAEVSEMKAWMRPAALAGGRRSRR